MEKKTLSDILEGKIFYVPDYQRGYAWQEKQWKDFVQDIDALTDENIKSHYTGTIVLYQSKDLTGRYGVDIVPKVEVVDGQQRLTTCSLYLSIILNRLIKNGEEEYQSKLPYLYCNAESKVTLNNDSKNFFYDLIKNGKSNVEAINPSQKQLQKAYEYLNNHMNSILAKKGNNYLKTLFDTVTRKLNFSFYTIEEKSEIGMTFELMNSRGKDLTPLELLKNYLLYWVYRNTIAEEKDALETLINKAWSEAYINISKAHCSDHRGPDHQCLAITWYMTIDHKPKTWKGYAGFKEDNVIPLRHFVSKSKEKTKTFIDNFIDNLPLVSKHYALITSPQESMLGADEFKYLTKIRNAGNIATFLPLLIAAKIKKEADSSLENSYIEMLKALEKYSFRVFLWSGRRSNSGMSKLYRLANDLFFNKITIESATKDIYVALDKYSPEESFRKNLRETSPAGWYSDKRRLKYTLFEYELHLLRGRNEPKLRWVDLAADSTIEHIYPQNPKDGSQWLKDWSSENRLKYLHDIGNLVLTKDNSRYLNFDYARKKGGPGIEYCYFKSDIKQEREVSDLYTVWTPAECENRRTILTDWILSRWGVERKVTPQEILSDIEEPDDEDDVDIFEEAPSVEEGAALSD